MSSYTTTASIAAISTAFGNYRPSVAVNRNGLETTLGDKVRLDVTNADGDVVSVALSAGAAERLATAILEAADLTTPLTDDGPHTGGIGGRAVSYRDPSTTALNAVRVAVANALDAGNSVGMILERVADGLTGKLAGYVERAAGRRMAAVFAEVAATDVAVLRADEQHLARWVQAQAVAAEQARRDGWDA